MKLTRTQLKQLDEYCEWAQSSGIYYGNRAQFIARHNAIVSWIQEQLK